MNDFEKMLAVLKMAGEDLGFIHRNISGDGFFEAHDKLGEWYSEASEEIDALSEIGISLGYREPTIQECVLMHSSPAASDAISVNDGIRIAGEIADKIMGAMESAKAVCPSDVISDIDGYIHKWRLVANYFCKKIKYENKMRKVEDDE